MRPKIERGTLVVVHNAGGASYLGTVRLHDEDDWFILDNAIQFGLKPSPGGGAQIGGAPIDVAEGPLSGFRIRAAAYYKVSSLGAKVEKNLEEMLTQARAQAAGLYTASSVPPRNGPTQ